MSSAVEVKEQQVKEFGIGEDININFYAWDGPFLVAICAMSSQLMALAHESRFMRVADAICILRQALAIDNITMVAEGYISVEPRETEGLELAAAFVKMPGIVKECITFTHVHGDQVTFMTKPYTYTVPRTVIWEDEVFTPGQTVMRGGNARYPLMMSKVLADVEPSEIPEDANMYFDTLGFGLKQLGFDVTWL